jgi:AraC family transcriptional regulator, L-rhamnose operon transcriptional activator RhaR
MDKKLYYFDTGERLFREGEAIYINRSREQLEPHLHAHEFIEIAYVAAGQGIHRVRDNEYSVSKGDLFLINYNIPHEFRPLPNNSGSELIIYNCVFKPEFLDSSLSNCRDFSDMARHFAFRSRFPPEGESYADIRLIGRESSEISEIYERMYREYAQQGDGYIELLKLYVNELLIKVFRMCRKAAGQAGDSGASHGELVEKAIVYMKNNFNRSIKLEELSMVAFLSPSYFCRLFKDSTGITVSEYIQKLRMEEACRLLLQTDMKVVNIAEEVGYKDLKHFNELFKRIVGKNPSSYRKKA